jgi:hypothetical protein
MLKLLPHSHNPFQMVKTRQRGKKAELLTTVEDVARGFPNI